MIRFGEYLNELRLRKRITLRKFSIDMKVNSAVVSQLERGVIDFDDYFSLDEVSEYLELDKYNFDFLVKLSTMSNIVPQVKLVPAFPPKQFKDNPELHDRLIDKLNEC